MFWHKNLIVDTTVTAETVTANYPSNQIPAFVWLCLCCINETYMLNKTPDLETQHSAVVEPDTVVKNIQKEKDTKYVRRAHMYLWWLVNDVICEFPFFVISSSLLHFIALWFPWNLSTPAIQVHSQGQGGRIVWGTCHQILTQWLFVQLLHRLNVEGKCPFQPIKTWMNMSELDFSSIIFIFSCHVPVSTPCPLHPIILIIQPDHTESIIQTTNPTTAREWHVIYVLQELNLRALFLVFTNFYQNLNRLFFKRYRSV